MFTDSPENPYASPSGGSPPPPERFPVNVDFFSKYFVGPPNLGARFKFFLTGALFPLYCAGVVIVNGDPPVLLSPWQSGANEDYIAMLLGGQCQLVFAPLILYSVGCLLFWIVRPTAARFFMVRLGLYSGVPLAGQYLLLFLATSQFVTLFCAAFTIPVVALVSWLVGLLLQHFQRFTILHLLFLTTVVAVISALLRLLPSIAEILDAFIIVAAATPTLNFITYLRAASMVFHSPYADEPQTDRAASSRAIGVAALVIGWIATWKFAVDVMLAEYAKLPTTDPNCYVSTAASRRHAWLFREKRPGGVSLQTKRLKFLEIALRCAAPRLHAPLRRIYDRLGPPLAAQCKRSSWLADLSYLALLPLEGAAVLLRRLLQIPAQKISRLYETPIIQSRFPH